MEASKKVLEGTVEDGLAAVKKLMAGAKVLRAKKTFLTTLESFRGDLWTACRAKDVNIPCTYIPGHNADRWRRRRRRGSWTTNANKTLVGYFLLSFLGSLRQGQVEPRWTQK